MNNEENIKKIKNHLKAIGLLLAEMGIDSDRTPDRKLTRKEKEDIAYKKWEIKFSKK